MNGNTSVYVEFYIISEEFFVYGKLGWKQKLKKNVLINYLKQNTEIKFAILIGLVQLVITMTCFVSGWMELKKEKNTHKYIYIDVMVVNLKMTNT